jgi:hypothetical protein
MACKLSPKQIEALYKVVLGEIVAAKNAGRKYNPEEHIKTLYNTILGRNKDQANALDYIQHMPTMIITGQASNEDIADFLQDSGVSIDGINKLRRDFKDVNNILNFVGAGQNLELETALELAQEQADEQKFASPDTYESVEKQDEELKKGFKAMPTTGYVLGNQEAQDYGGLKAEDNVPDPDPKKQAYFALTRRLNQAIAESGALNADNLSIDGFKGIFIMPVREKEVPYEELYESHKEYLNKNDEGKTAYEKARALTSEQKMKFREEGDGIFLIYADKDGNHLYVDESGRLNKDGIGTLPYATLRRPKYKNGEWTIIGVQTVEDLLAKPGAPSKEELEAERNYQIETLKKIREYAVKNPDKPLMLSVAPGRNGYVKEDFSKKNKIANISLDQGFSPSYSPIANDPYKKGGVYFTVKDYDFPVLLKRPTFAEIGLNTSLGELLFGDTLSDKEKIDLLQQFAYSKQTSAVVRDGKLFIKQQDQTLDTTDPANKQKFVDTISTQIVNINKDLLGGSVMVPVMNAQGTGYQLQSQNYSNFLANNFYTNLELNAENKIVKLNAYNTFQINKDTQEKLYPSKPVEEKTKAVDLTAATPTDQSIEQLKEKLKGLGGLKKNILLDSTATDEQITVAEKWYINSPLRNQIEFKALFNVINSNARAEFTLAGITLFNGANYTDLYHEGWHVFSQIFLTKEQKKSLYNEARKLKGTFKTADGRTVAFSKAMDIQLEEFLAEDFRKYVLSDGTRIIENRSTRNNIFNKIYNFLKALFTGQSLQSYLADQEAVGKVKELYDKLLIGDINEYSPSLFNVQFGLLNKGVQALDAKPTENNGLTYQESMILNESIDSLMSGVISELGQGVGVVITNPEIMGYVYAAVKTRLEQLRAKATDPNAQKILDFGIENFGDYDKVVSGEQVNGAIAFHKLRSAYLTFEDKFADATIDEKNDIQGEVESVADDENLLGKSEAQLQEEFGTTAFERKGNENSILAIASSETVYMVKSLPLLDKKGNPVLNLLGTAKQVDFNKTWGILINAVAGSIDKSDMHAKLVKAAQTFPELKALVQDVTVDGAVQTARLPRPTDKVNNETDSIYYRMWTAFFRDFSVYRIPIKEVQVIKEVTTTEKGKIATGKFQVRFVESEPLFQQVQTNFTNAFQTSPASRYIKVGPSGVNELNLDNILIDFPKSTLFQGDNYFRFLRAIGFYMTDNTLVKENLLKVRRSIDFIHSAIQKMQKDKVAVTNPLAALEGESGNRKKILNVEGAYSTKYNNNAVTNVNGDAEYDLSLNNGITQVAKELNDIRKATYDEVVKQPHMAHLDVTRNPNAKYGVLLGSMFELPITWKEIDLSNRGFRRKVGDQPVIIEVDNLNGIKNIFEDATSGVQTNEGGIKTLSLDPNSKMLMDFHMLLESGVMELTRRGSKSSAFGAHVNNINTEFNANDKALYISTGLFADPVKARNAQVTLLKAKLAAEMERIAIVKSDPSLNNIINFTERGKTFQMFDDILSNELKAELIEAADPNDSYSVVNNPKFSERISNGISNYMENLYQENKAMFDEMGFVSEQMKTKVRRLAEKDSGRKNLKSDELAEIALRSFTFNSLFHNMEITALFDGDYAVFNHDKEEYSKRSSYVTSTGRIFSTDASDYAFITNLGGAYAKKIGAAPREFNGVLNTAVFRDVKLKSKYFDVYVDALVKSGMSKDEAKKTLKPYSDMTEGDAQGWLTFDTYRSLSLLQNEWSPKQNDLYNKIIQGQKVDPQEIAQYFPPRKFQYSGPLQTSKLHIPAFHKFSLAPLIPSVIQGTELETLHDNLVRQGVDYALFESGSKLATLTNDGQADQFYENDNYDERTIKAWKQGDPEYKKNPIFLQYLKSQVDINDEWKNKTIFSTQLRVLIINNLYKNGVPLNQEFGKLVNELEGLLNTLQNYKKQELLREIGWVTDEKGEPKGDLTKLVAFVKKELTRQDLADHDIEFVDVNEAGTALKNDLSFSLNAEKIEKLLNSIVVKRLVRQKVNGEQLIQVSGAGFESRAKFRKASEEETLKYKGTNDLPTYMPGAGKNGATTAMKVKIAMKGDYYKLLELNSVKDYAKKYNIPALQALNELLKNDNWLDADDNRKLITMVGVRIPVQGFNSMEFMEVYEFLPEEAGNIIIPPAEIVAKAGSDFDIDKLTIFQPNYSSSKPFASYSKGNNAKGTENKIIENIRQILEHADNFADLIRPNDVDLVKGTANDLAEQNIQGYNPLENKTLQGTKKSKDKSVISPTRGLEPRYNYYKHESNNIGKITLGIGAVDNKYSAIMKRVGLRLMPNYTYRTASGKEHTRRTHIAMAHNTVTEGGMPYISLGEIDTKTQQKISDLIGQLMNGWVDVEKDAWIFNINGNSVAGPVLLFLLESGVDFKTAAYFISQPVIIDYIKERYRSDSPFYDASGQGENKGRGLNKYNIRKKFVNDYVERLETYTTKLGDTREKFSAEILYDKYISKRVSESKEFTPEQLLNNIKSKNKTSEVSKQTLLHFFELEDMMKELTNIKLSMNVDTNPSKSFTDAYARKVKIDALNQTDIVDQSVLTKIKKETPISSFFVQDFQLNLFKPIMKVRADKAINDYLLGKIKDREYESMFADIESFASAFKNDIGLYILQNSMKGFDLANLKEYNSLVTSSKLPVEAVQLKYGAFVKDGVMYVDAKQIRQDFDTKAFSNDTFKKRGLHVLAPETFNTAGNTESGFQEYARFVLEREYLRSVLPINKNESRESYEKRIAERALETTFNFYTLVKSKENIAVRFQQIAKDNPDLASEYMIFDQVTGVGTQGQKGMKTLKLKSSKLDRDTRNVLHENLMRLADYNTIKVGDPVKNLEISKFFRRLILGEFLRAGITKTSDSLAPILPTETITKLLEKPIKDLTESGKLTSKEFLDGYFEMFKANWSLSKKSTRNRFRNYLKPAALEYQPAQKVDEEQEGPIRQSETGALVFTAPVSQTSAAKFLAENPSTMFVYPTNATNKVEELSKKYQDAGNSLPIPVKEGAGVKSWSDETYDENIKLINQALNTIQDQIESGSVVAFPAEGLTTVATKEGMKDVMRSQAPRTFEYLATELYKRFKYAHPEAEKTLGFRKEIQAGQPITDEEVDDFMKKCFGG